MSTQSEILANAWRSKTTHETMMRHYLRQEQSIDNVAVLFSNPNAEQAFTDHCVDLGWEQFNVSADHVTGHLGRENYDVGFRFLRPTFGEGPPFRIETMLLDPRDSAIHAALLSTFGEGAIAQGSFKNNGSNALASYQQGNALLAARGWRLVEVFASTYGPYTYFVPPSGTYEDGYLKVRRNERDAT